MSPRDKWEIGRDGLPTSPDHPWNRDRRTLAEIDAEAFKRELGYCERAWRCGRVAEAVADAILLCEKRQVAPPRWLCEAVRTVVERAPAVATRKWDMIHYARWDAVQELRDRKGERGIPKTWPGCYDLVSEEFERTADPARGSPETIRKSYKDVAKEMRSRSAHRYYLGRTKPG